MATVYDTYLKAINTDYLNGDATEHTHRPALKAFVEGLGSHITATNEPKQQTDCGKPDMKVSRQIRHTQQAFGYIECKDIGIDLKREEKSEQLKRYRAAIDNLILTDYIHFRFYRLGELVETATLAREGSGGKFIATESSIDEVKKLFALFFASEPVKLTSPKELAQRMAGIARLLRGVIDATFSKESDHGALHGQYEAFKKVLLHDMKEDEFADMYAQTICYGLFAARCHLNDETVWGKDAFAAHHGVDGKAGEFTREKAAYLLPKTNPFLRNIFGDIAGVGMDERIAWLVDDLVTLLKNAAMDKVLKGFGRITQRTDPVVHFYETFLAAYDPKLRESRGVYYTPEPVVSYIVRSVDWLLKEKFGLAKGLADNKKIELQKAKKTKQDASSPLKVHRCLVLDPAVGTGTFLYEVIQQIRKKFRDKGAWGAYVKEHLLPRLFGFELMMAPYAICHMKLGLELAETGYAFDSDERLGVYLTNTLEEAEEMGGLPLFTQWLAEEARAANVVKRDLPIMVVLGNPPYSYESSNTGEWISNLVRDYYFVDGQPLGERNPRGLQDDYVKFIRYGQHRIEQTGSGILAFITNHGYIDNPTFRGMRQSLMQTFNEIYILDLHGNSKKKEVCPDGSPDKNVFDIQQGVSIGIFVKEPNKNNEAEIYRAELWGERKEKYEWLNRNEITSTIWSSINNDKPYYFYKSQDIKLLRKYEKYSTVTDVMPKYSVGIVTSRDNLSIQFSEDEARNIGREFVSLDVEEARLRFNLKKDSRDWQVALAQKDLLSTKLEDGNLKTITYRPFDNRYTYYTGNSRGYHSMPREEVMRNMLFDNIALVTSRMTKGEEFSHLLVTRNITEKILLSAKTSNNGFHFPLYLYSENETEKGKQRTFDDVDSGDWESGKDGRVPNLDKGFVEGLADIVKLSFVSDGRGDFLEFQDHGQAEIDRAAHNKKSGRDARVPSFGPEDIFAWIYGVFHSPQYRQRYAEFLKIDFPRIPLPKDRKQFADVCAVGHELVGLHLMESDALERDDLLPRFGVEGDMEVEKGYPKFDAGRVYVNEKQSFDGVREDVWDFMIGGYQVCEKWLKDRRGRKLSYDDIEHYKKICAALGETIRLMADKRLDIFE